MTRNRNLDLLKIFACFCVVSLHVVGFREGMVNDVIYYLSGSPVPIFFMVNGFLLLNKKEITYPYILKKVGMMLGVMFVWNLIFLVYTYFISNKTILLNPFSELLHNVFQQYYFWQFWFFGALILLYLVLPLLHRLYKMKNGPVIMAAFFFLCCVVMDICSMISAINGKGAIQPQVNQTLRLWNWFFYFFLGGLFGRPVVHETLQKKISMPVNIIAVIVLSAGVFSYQYNVATKLYAPFISVEFYYENILTMLWVLSIFLLIFRLPNADKPNRLIRIFSGCIMGVYIIHPTIIEMIQKNFYDYSNQWLNVVMIFVVFLISLIIALILSVIPVVKKLVQL